MHGGVEKGVKNGKMSPSRPPLRRAQYSVRATGRGRMGCQWLVQSVAGFIDHLGWAFRNISTPVPSA